jgi:tetratricopeptide (TPR) repeat protein
MESEARKLCDMGREFLDRGEPEEALRCYERALDVEPENPDAWCGRGKAAYDLGRLERADRDFRRALRFAQRELSHGKKPRRWWADPATRPYLRALHGHGLCRFWLGAYEDAAKVFRRLLKLAPTDPLDVRFLVGETYLRMGRIERAVRDLAAVEDDPDALYNLGLARFYQGDFAGSVNAFRRAFFANLHLPRMLVEAEGVPARREEDDEEPHGKKARRKEPSDAVPTDAGTHPKGLDGESAANDYVDRCGDLWFGRPVLQRWLWGVHEHVIVKRDVATHLEQVRALSADGTTSPGERARLEGANASLRSAERLAATDAVIAKEILAAVFVLPEGEGKKA